MITVFDYSSLILFCARLATSANPQEGVFGCGCGCGCVDVWGEWGVVER